MMLQTAPQLPTYVEPAPRPRLFILDIRNGCDKQRLQLPHSESGRLVFGADDAQRATSANVDLTYYDGQRLGVSRLHAVINLNFYPMLTDLGSKWGTFLNGERVLPHTSRRLYNGDIIRLGMFVLYVTLDESHW